MSPRPIKGDGAMEVWPLASRSERWDIFWGSRFDMICRNLEIKIPLLRRVEDPVRGERLGVRVEMLCSPLVKGAWGILRN